MARVGIAAGTATAVSNRVSRRQGNRWAAEDQGQYEAAPAPTEQAPPPEDRLAKLKELGELHESGVLTDEEFTQQKTLLLNG